MWAKFALCDALQEFHSISIAHQNDFVVSSLADERKGEGSIPSQVKRWFLTTPSLGFWFDQGPPIPLSAIAFTRLSKSWPWTGFHVNLAGSTRHPHVFTSSTNYPPPNHFKNIYIFQKKIKSALKSWSFLKSKIFNFVRSVLITTERFFWDLSAGINPKIN